MFRKLKHSFDCAMHAVDKSLAIRPLKPQEWTQYRELRLRALADSPDAFGSTLAEEKERAPDAWAMRLTAAAASGQDYPLIAEHEGNMVGLAWAKVDAANPSIVNVYQMWVAPEARRRGVAAALLRDAIKWARSMNRASVQLGVTCADSAAVRLYVREGFRDIGTPAPLRPGSPLLSQTMRLELGESEA